MIRIFLMDEIPVWRSSQIWLILWTSVKPYGLDKCEAKRGIWRHRIRFGTLSGCYLRKNNRDRILGIFLLVDNSNLGVAKYQGFVTSGRIWPSLISSTRKFLII